MQLAALGVLSQEGNQGSANTEADANLARAADYMARKALEGHIAFDTDEIREATGVDVEAIDQEVLQQAVLGRVAELRDALEGSQEVNLAAQEGLVILETFDQFVAAFNQSGNAPRLVLLLSPT